MADPQTKTETKVLAPTKARFDLVNPTRARRIIHDGLTPMKSVTIEPGETKRDVELHPDIAKELKQRTRPRGKENSDLHVYAAGQAPDPTKAVEADEDEDDAE